jgi:glucokinase
MRIVAADIGGTHARFVLATLNGGRVAELGEPVTLRTSEHVSFESAWEEFGRRGAGPLPRDLAIALAGPVDGKVLKLTNKPWVISPGGIARHLGLDRVTVINDFGAVAHGVSVLGDDHFGAICGAPGPLPRAGVITIVGPGTGLGVAALLRRQGEDDHVIATEGGHVDFAPLDSLEDRMLSILRGKFRRVSVERIVSGPGLWNIYDALCAIERRPLQFQDDHAIWPAALAGEDPIAAAALDRFCLSLGAIAGDLALAQGAAGVVIAGGVGLRLRDHLPRSGFRDRLIAKGRFERRMADLPARLITHPHPGLLGAAAAFAREHR